MVLFTQLYKTKKLVVLEPVLKQNKTTPLATKCFLLLESSTENTSRIFLKYSSTKQTFFTVVIAILNITHYFNNKYTDKWCRWTVFM